MTAQELVELLQNQSVKLELADGKIVCKAPKGIMTAALLEQLKRCRQEIVGILEVGGAAQGIAPRPPDAAAAPSFAQQRLWLFDQLEPGSPLFNMPTAARLGGRLDVDALERAMNEIVRRHAALRTTFIHAGNTLEQAIAPSLALPMPVVDLSALPAAEREDAVQRHMRDDAQTPFDLATGPLIRARLLKLDERCHVLLLNLHHIVCDGWSLAVLAHERSVLYGAYVRKLPSPLPELPIQYADFAHWQRQRLTGDVLQRHLAYWTAQLDGATLLLLPTDRPRPQVPTFRGTTHRFEVSPETTAALHALNRRAGTTMFMTLCAVFNVLLSRYSGQDDICIGTAIANRNRSETEPLIGLFVNTLVMRTRIDADAGFDALLQQVRGTALDGYAHQDLPFEQLLEVLKPERHINQSPLFQVMLILQNTPDAALALPDMSMRQLVPVSTVAKLDLTFDIAESGGRLNCGIEYNTDLFDAGTIAAMERHFVRLLDAAATDRSMRVGDMPMLGAEERKKILFEWNDTAAGHQNARPMHRLFEAQAAQTPQAPAVVFDDGAQTHALSYAELNAKANRLARHLRACGAGPDTLIGICVERSLEMAVGLLAILKSGAAYVPLDPAYPDDRLAAMLGDAGPIMLLTQQPVLQTLASRVVAPGMAVFCLDEQWPSLARHGTEDLDGTALPESLAYVIYTSGSTGKPKGVAVRHSALTNFIHAMQQSPGIARDDALLSVTSLSFDIAALELFLPLAAGAKTILTTRDIAATPDRLAALMQRHRVSMMQATPSTWRMLADHGWTTDRPLTLLCGGEALPVDLAGQLLRRVPQLWNMYGPTETTIWSALHCVQSAAAAPPIGRPIGNTQIYILDARLEPVPVGAAGELHIAGDGLARGYLNRPDLTADKFIPNPFSAAGERMYQSGDLARHRADGSIEYLGRIDGQLKIRGFRIESGEVEAALATLPPVGQAVVVAREDMGGKHLAAYLVLRHGADDTQLSAHALRAALLRSLPDYMVPSSFTVLEKMPLTPNGKIDRKALPAPGTTRKQDDCIAPRTPDEHALAAVWADVLALDRIGVTDNFFTLGGHSLLAIGMIGRLKQIGMFVTARQLFLHPTIEQLAAAIQHGGRQDAARTPAAQEAVLGPSPVLPNNYWFLQRRDLHHWNLSFLLETPARYRPALLKKAVAALVEHHDALRTVWTRDGAQAHRPWRQYFQCPEEMAPWWESVDLSQLEDTHATKEIEARCATAQASLDITKVLFRVIHFDLGQERDGRLMFVVHHLLIDAYSRAVLVEDLTRLTHAIEQGLVPSLPPKTTSVKELAAAYEALANNLSTSADWARAYPAWSESAVYWSGDTVSRDGIGYRANWWSMGQEPSANNGGPVSGQPWSIVSAPLTPRMEEELAYWRSRPWQKYRPLPAERHPEQLLPDTGVSQPLFLYGRLDAKETRQLEAIPHIAQLSLEDLLLTALVLAYGEWGGAKALCVCLVHHGRSALEEQGIDLSRTVGCLINYAIRLFDIDDQLSLCEAAYAIRAQRKAIRGKEADYSMLRYMHDDALIRQEMDNRPGPQLEQNFFPHEAAASEWATTGFRLARENSGEKEGALGSRFRPFSKAFFHPENHCFTLEWAYCPSMYTEASIAALMDANISALRSLIQCFHTPREHTVAVGELE